MDGVYYARGRSGLTGSLFDIDSVEVLKGPQGTLVGRNSTGGAILLRDPRARPTISAAMSRSRGGDYGRAETARRGQHSAHRHAVLPRRALKSATRRAISPITISIPPRGFRNTQPAMGSQEDRRDISRSNGSRTTASTCCCAPISPPSMIPARPITIWAISSARGAARRQALDLQYSRHLHRLHRSSGPSDRALLHHRHRDQRQRRSIPRRPPTIRC